MTQTYYDKHKNALNSTTGNYTRENVSNGENVSNRLEKLLGYKIDPGKLSL